MLRLCLNSRPSRASTVPSKRVRVAVVNKKKKKNRGYVMNPGMCRIRVPVFQHFFSPLAVFVRKASPPPPLFPEREPWNDMAEYEKVRA